MMLIKKSNYENIENDLLILKYSCNNKFKVVYNNDDFLLNIDELVIDDYNNYKHNKGTNLDLDNLLCLSYCNKYDDCFIYEYK